MIPEEAKDIYLYYGIAVVIGVLWVLTRRQAKVGMRLRLGPWSNPEEAERALAKVTPLSRDMVEAASTERSLNVVFNYNGHSWDAYEVLGLPAGCNLERVEESFRQALSTVDAQSRPFLTTAYQAIQTQRGKIKATKSS